MRRLLPLAGAFVLSILLIHNLALRRANQNPFAENAAGRALDIHLREVAQWGCAECEGPEQLTLLRDVAVDEDGSVFVLNRYEPFVRGWTRDGQHSISFGTTGEGPGEMVSPRSISVHDGMISVVDLRLRRWSMFDSRGTFVKSWRLPGRTSRAGYSTADRSLLYAAPGPRCSAPRLWRVPRDPSDLASIIATIDDAPTDHLSEVNCYLTVRAFAVNPEGGLAVGYGELDYLVLQFSADGSLARKIARDIEREPKTAADREIDDEIARKFVARGMEPPPDDPLRYHFYGDSIRYDSEGRLWVRTARGGDTDVVFDVFDPDGGFLDSFSISAAKVRRDGDAFEVAGDYLVTIRVDENDVPYLTLWQVRWQ